jgi:hypothetical protein
MCWLHAVEIAVDLKNLGVKGEISPKWQLHGCQALNEFISGLVLKENEVV